MSSVMNPVGPEDSGVYWRRRALVGGIALLVLFLFWFVLLRPGGGSDPVPVADTSSPAASLSASPASSESGSPSASPSQSPSSSAGGTCAEDDITVTVTTDSQTYAGDEDPAITMQIQNTGGSACTRDIGSGANTIEISSGGVAVWSSDDCLDTGDGAPDIATLDAGKAATLNVTWDRTASSGGCEDPPQAAPGAYEVVGTNLGVDSQEVTFTLE